MQIASNSNNSFSLSLSIALHCIALRFRAHERPRIASLKSFVLVRPNKKPTTRVRHCEPAGWIFKNIMVQSRGKETLRTRKYWTRPRIGVGWLDHGLMVD